MLYTVDDTKTTEDGKAGNNVDEKKGLLDLPAEIWSNICRLAVENERPIDIKVRKMDDARIRAPQPAITRVCRCTREECLLHYYNVNTFYDRSPTTEGQLTWLTRIGKTNREALGRFYFPSPKRHHTSELFEELFLGEDTKMRLHDASSEEHQAFFPSTEPGSFFCCSGCYRLFRTEMEEGHA